MRMTIQLLPQPHNAACCARGRVAAGGDAFALMRVANALSVYAILLYQTWRKSSFGRLSVGEPRSSHTPSTNARRAMCATSARDGAPSATIFAESWDLEVLARTVSSQSYSAISWTWRCSPDRERRHRPIPKKPRAGEGHDVLFAQDLDNPLWVAHMPHPTNYDYDGLHPYPFTVTHSCKRGARRGSASGFRLCFVRCSCRTKLKAASLVRVGGRCS